MHLGSRRGKMGRTRDPTKSDKKWQGRTTFVFGSCPALIEKRILFALRKTSQLIATMCKVRLSRFLGGSFFLTSKA